jgi:hypothetical protein
MGFRVYSYSSSYDGFFEFEIILHDLHNENDKDKGLVVWLFEGIFHFFYLSKPSVEFLNSQFSICIYTNFGLIFCLEL